MTVPIHDDDVRMILRAHAAVHEAGHAIAGLELGLDLVEISMSGGDPTGATFFVSFDRPVEDLFADDPDHVAPMLLAGKCAETMFFEAHVNKGYSQDVQVIINVTRRQRVFGDASPTNDQANALLLPWVEAARALVRDHRAAVETVATALLTAPRLSRAEVDALRERALVRPVHLPKWATSRSRTARPARPIV